MIKCQKCFGRSQLFLCENCTVELRDQLLGMPTLVDRLNDSALGVTRLSSGSRQLGFSSRPPPTVNHQALSLIGAIECTIGSWAVKLSNMRGYIISVPINRNPINYRYTVYDYSMFLAAHVHDLAKDADVGELCSALRDHIRHGVGDDKDGDDHFGDGIINRRMPAQYCGPCPSQIIDHRHCVDCGNRSHECAKQLSAPRGAVEVTCPSCGALYRVERLVNTLLARADDYRCSLSEMYRVLRMLKEPVKPRTLQNWAKVGLFKPVGYLRPDNRRIAPVRHSDDDKPVYRVSDVRKVREEQSRPGRSGRPLNGVAKNGKGKNAGKV